MPIPSIVSCCLRVEKEKAMIDEPMFSEIHNVYDYLGYKDPIDRLSDCSRENLEAVQYDFVSAGIVEVYDSFDCCFQLYSLHMTLFHTIMFGMGENEGCHTISTLTRLYKQGFEKRGKLSLDLDGELMRFEDEVDRDAAAEFVAIRSRLAQAAMENGVREAFEIADRLYSSGYAQAMKNFKEAIPDILYTNIQAAMALLFFIGVQDHVLSCYSRIEEPLYDMCREFISNGNEEAYDQIKELFVNLAEVLESEEGIDGALSMTVGFLLYRKRLIEDYSKAWKDAYGDLPGDDLESYVLMCVNENRVSEEDSVALSASSYCLMGANPTYLEDDYVWTIRALFELVEDAEKKKSKSSFRSMLFANNSDEPGFRFEGDSKSKVTIDDVDMMTGDEFELLVAKLFEAMKYDVSVTQHSADQGIDVVARKGSMVLGIQAKCYSQPVGNSAVQEAVAGKAYYNCRKVMVVTNSSFTASARQLATANGVLLWTREILAKKLIEHPVSL